MSVVITHPDYGIFVGHAIGLGFWSRLDAAGQDTACVFESEQQAREFIRTWKTNSNPDDYEYQEVACADGFHATVEELRAAGLQDQLGDLEMESLRNTPAMGTC